MSSPWWYPDLIHTIYNYLIAMRCPKKLQSALRRHGRLLLCVSTSILGPPELPPSQVSNTTSCWAWWHTPFPLIPLPTMLHSCGNAWTLAARRCRRLVGRCERHGQGCSLLKCPLWRRTSVFSCYVHFVRDSTAKGVTSFGGRYFPRFWLLIESWLIFCWSFIEFSIVFFFLLCFSFVWTTMVTHDWLRAVH